MSCLTITTAISYVNNKAGNKSKVFNETAKELQLWYYSRNMWVSAAQIPADSFSRNFSRAIEWKLSPHLYQKISCVWKTNVSLVCIPYK